jgi:hypothetical protein
MRKFPELVLIIIIFFIFPLLSAQKTKDVLYLKNGSMIYGKLIEITDNKYKIKTSDGSIFIYPSQEVEKFINETPDFAGRKKSGPGFALEAGFLVGVKTTDYVTPFTFNILGNVTCKTKHLFGLGSGVEYIGQPYMPVFFEYKYLLYDRKTSPFIFLRGGNLFHLIGDIQNSDSYTNPNTYTKTYHGGFSFTIGTGISWIKNENETYLSFAYRNAHMSYEQLDYNNQNITYKSALNRLEIKFGFRF